MSNIKQTLVELLGESDVHRPLDSLESLVIHAQLADAGYRETPVVVSPNTIEEWVRWADRHSPES